MQSLIQPHQSHHRRWSFAAYAMYYKRIEQSSFLTLLGRFDGTVLSLRYYILLDNILPCDVSLSKELDFHRQYHNVMHYSNISVRIGLLYVFA